MKRNSLIELFCIARLSRIEKEERRRRAQTENESKWQLSIKKQFEKTFFLEKKKPKLNNQDSVEGIEEYIYH